MSYTDVRLLNNKCKVCNNGAQEDAASRFYQRSQCAYNI